MSYSLQEPEWPPICECLYDETRDEMFRGDCPLHCELDDESQHAPLLQAERKPPASIEAASRKRKAKRGES